MPLGCHYSDHIKVRAPRNQILGSVASVRDRLERLVRAWKLKNAGLVLQRDLPAFRFFLRARYDLCVARLLSPEPLPGFGVNPIYRRQQSSVRKSKFFGAPAFCV